MPKFNDINPNEFNDSAVWTDSLWIIEERDNSGKHSNFFHGNFVPQVVSQLILRYTKKGDTVFDPFIGGGTTAIECEKEQRNCIGIDIQSELVEYINQSVNPQNSFNYCIVGDSSDKDTFVSVKKILKQCSKENIQLAILHPPYFDIIKFTDMENDLSNSSSLEAFRNSFKKVVQNTVDILENGRYLAVVIGDKYTAGEWIPLAFYVMTDVQSLGLKLKSIIVKNMSGNRAKKNMQHIWRYRALTSDYYIFKHEYIFIFKKESMAKK